MEEALVHNERQAQAARRREIDELERAEQQQLHHSRRHVATSMAAPQQHQQQAQAAVAGLNLLPTTTRDRFTDALTSASSAG